MARQWQRIQTQDLKDPESFSCDPSNASKILAFFPPRMMERLTSSSMFSLMGTYDWGVF